MRSHAAARATLASVLSLAAVIAPSGQRAVGFSTPSTSMPARSDEFVGPFPSWARVTTYGAAGDGVADDTDAIQRGLTELGTDGRSSVLFLPAGTYRITRTLVLDFRINVSVVGEHPERTTIVWDGRQGGTMLRVNGLAYSRITRLTFNGRRTAGTGIDQSWDGSRPHFDTGNEYSDLALLDVGYGIRGGFLDRGFAETSILRSRFVRNTRAGVALGNFNALDAWIWHSTFEDCTVGVTNEPGAGNFRVYGSVFRRSTVSDLVMGNTGGFSARGNYSTGSGAFFLGSATNNPATIHLQGNVIVDTVAATPIRMGNQGPAILTDNVIRSLPDAAGPVVEWFNLLGADLTSIGNRYTVTAPVSTRGRLLTLDDRVVARAEIDVTEPGLPPVLPSLSRHVVEVPAGSDTARVQAAIAEAARRIGTRPVVHLADGVYEIARTLVVPRGDVQLVGDGFGTVLRWTGESTGPVVRLAGPSQVTMRELTVDGAGRADGILVEGADQAGARVYMQQAQLRAGRTADLFVDGIDHTQVQLENFGHAYSPDAVAVRVTGGPLSAAGRATTGRTSIYSGASSGNRTSYEVSDGATVLVRDLWYESGAGPGFARIRGRATFTLDGARVSSPAGEAPAVDVAGLNGRVAVLATHFDDRIVWSGDGQRGEMLALGNVAERLAEASARNDTAPSGRMVVALSRHVAPWPAPRTMESPTVGLLDSAFIRRLLAHARSDSAPVLTSLSSGVTDVRFFRVWVTAGLVNVRLTRE
jgi:hypothetical protein